MKKYKNLIKNETGSRKVIDKIHSGAVSLEMAVDSLDDVLYLNGIDKI